MLSQIPAFQPEPIDRANNVPHKCSKRPPNFIEFFVKRMLEKRSVDIVRRVFELMTSRAD
jgi:hypothetical protein